MRVIIQGPPITKKNSINLVAIGARCPACKRKTRVIPLPSEAFKMYQAAASAQLKGIRCVLGPVSVRCLYWLPTARRPDLCNLLAASHDILEACGIIENDALIISVDGSRIMGKDAGAPRVEIEILAWQGETGPGVSLSLPPIGPPGPSHGLDFPIRG